MTAPVPALPFERQVLANGLTVAVQSRPTSGVVAMSLAVMAGARDENPAALGAHNLVTRAHLLGSAAFPTEDVLRRTVAITGGGIGASAGRELSQFSVTVPADEFELALTVLADIVSSPLFDAEALVRDRTLVLQEIARRTSEPSAVAMDSLVEAVWTGHPAGHATTGTDESIGRLSRDALLELRKAAFTGKRMTLSVVGQVPADTAFERVADTLGGRPAGTALRREPVLAANPATRNIVERKVGRKQANVYLGIATAGRRDADRYALILIDAVLGSPAGRLFGEIRTKRGLAYHAGSGVSFLDDTGLFYTRSGTDPANVDQVVTLMDHELARLISEPLSDAVLEQAKNQVVGQRVMGEETSGARASQIAALLALDCYETPETFARSIRSVMAEDIQRVAGRYFGGGSHLVVVRPE